jgi:hypothetical protein
MAAPVTQINASYLTSLQQNVLEPMLTEVKQQIAGIGEVSDSAISTTRIPAVNEHLSVEAGLETQSQQGNASGFQPAIDLNTALGNVGNSVNENLVWMEGVLNSMIDEINTTISSFSQNESLNSESAAQLQSDFQQVVTDMSQLPGSSGGSGS